MQITVESRQLRILPTGLTHSMNKREKIITKQARLPASNQTLSNGSANTELASGFYINDWAFYMMVGIFTTASVLVPLAILIFCCLKRRRNDKIFILHQQKMLESQLQYPVYSPPTTASILTPSQPRYYQRSASNMSDRMGSAYNLANSQNQFRSQQFHQISPTDRDRSLNRLMPQYQSYRSRGF